MRFWYSGPSRTQRFYVKGKQSRSALSGLGRLLPVPRSLEGTLEARSHALSGIASDAELERSVRYHRFLRRTARLVIEAVLLAALLSLLFLRFPQVQGRSMQPNIEQGNHVLINTLAYAFSLGRLQLSLHPIERGDVVAFQRQDGESAKIFLKRVVGVAGDTISIQNGAVRVNGTTLSEPYAIVADRSDTADVIVPPGDIFVLGDNRADSDDSRSFGPVSVPEIIGKAILIIWPLGRVRRID